MGYNLYVGFQWLGIILAAAFFVALTDVLTSWIGVDLSLHIKTTVSRYRQMTLLLLRAETFTSDIVSARF